jgi:hypothetical protein
MSCNWPIYTSQYNPIICNQNQSPSQSLQKLALCHYSSPHSTFYDRIPLMLFLILFSNISLYVCILHFQIHSLLFHTCYMSDPPNSCFNYPNNSKIEVKLSLCFYWAPRHEGLLVSKSFRTGCPERELKFSASRCSCIAILWVSLVSFAAITLCVAY